MTGKVPKKQTESDLETAISAAIEIAFPRLGAANIKPNVLGDLLSIAVGLALYLLFIYEVHYMLVGVDVLAG